MITLQILRKAAPDTSSSLLSSLITPLSNVCTKYNINTENRIAGFLANLSHESGGFTIMTENLNYSADRLLVVFKRHFANIQIARQYERQPQKIANHVYANRMGNGSESSGDGWKFRGRGYIQLTGKDNYQNFADDLKLQIDKAISYLETVEGAVESAGWFWDKNNLNRFCDRNDVLGLTKAINGGTNGHDHRKKLYDSIREAI